MSYPRQPTAKHLLGAARGYVDLVAVAAVVVGATAGVLLSAPTIVRVPFTALLVFVVPGYTLTSALFPTGETTLPGGLLERDDSITVLDRAVLSVATSLALVILVGLVVDVSPLPLSTPVLLGALVTLTAGLVPFSYYRRQRTPPDERFTVGTRWLHDRLAPSSVGLLSVVVVLSVLFAGGAVAYATTVADDDGTVTEFYFETADGEAAAYPTNLTRGEPRSLTLAVGNHEGESVDYTVVGQLQRARPANGTVVVGSRQRIHRSQLAVPEGETRTRNVTVTPPATGSYRLVYLLYRGEPPGEPTTQNAYREIHLWTSVTEPSGGARA